MCELEYWVYMSRHRQQAGCRAASVRSDRGCPALDLDRSNGLTTGHGWALQTMVMPGKAWWRKGKNNDVLKTWETGTRKTRPKQPCKHQAERRRKGRRCSRHQSRDPCSPRRKHGRTDIHTAVCGRPHAGASLSWTTAPHGKNSCWSHYGLTTSPLPVSLYCLGCRR